MLYGSQSMMRQCALQLYMPPANGGNSVVCSVMAHLTPAATNVSASSGGTGSTEWWVLAADFSSVELAAGKTTGMAVVAVSVALWQLFPLLSASDGAAVDLDSLWPGHGNLTSWLLIAWAALGPGAFASVLQTFGQAHVPASRAQVCTTHAHRISVSAVLSMRMLSHHGD